MDLPSINQIRLVWRGEDRHSLFFGWKDDLAKSDRETHWHLYGSDITASLQSLLTYIHEQSMDLSWEGIRVNRLRLFGVVGGPSLDFDLPRSVSLSFAEYLGQYLDDFENRRVVQDDGLPSGFDVPFSLS